MKTSIKSRQFPSLNSNNSTPSTPEPIAVTKAHARMERFLKATNSERYLPVSWRNTEKTRKENSSTSSSGSRDSSSKARIIASTNVMTDKESVNIPKSGRKSMDGQGNRSEGKLNIKPGLVKIFPHMIPLSKCESLVQITAKAIKPVVICRNEISYENASNNNGSSIFGSEAERASLYTSLSGKGPRMGDSLYQRLLQSGMTRKLKCNYFQIKTGKFVSPKIVKASRKYCPKTADSLLGSQSSEKWQNLLHLDKPNKETIAMLTNSTPKGKKSSPVRLIQIGATDKSKVNRE